LPPSAGDSKFKHYPTRPTATECQNAFTILCNAHDTASSLLEAFTVVRAERQAKGTPTDEEQDLLRACIVFAGAGLDSMTKQLIADALPAVVERSPGAETMFKQHVGRHMLRDATGELAPATLAEILADRDPRNYLIRRLIHDLTSGSLQSAEEVMRIASYFDIPSRDLEIEVKFAQEIFGARNQIVHEMDVHFDQVNRNRRSRTRAKVVSYTNEILRIASVLLTEVDARATSATP
jgi:hypothetical protein